jgi:hypothetical protein
VRVAEYRGVKAYGLDRAKLILFDRWLVLTNEDRFAKQIVDRWLDAGAGSLAAESTYEQARSAADPAAAAWGFVNIPVLRNAGAAKELFGGRVGNPATELLFGGLVSVLQHTPYVAASLDFQAEELRVVVSSPFDRGRLLTAVGRAKNASTISERPAKALRPRCDWLTKRC